MELYHFGTVVSTLHIWGGFRLSSQSRYHLSQLKFFVLFLSPSKQVLRYCHLQAIFTTFHDHPKFILHNHFPF